MSSSTGSGGVVGERAWRAAEAVVEGDCGCEREEAHLDAGCEAVEGAGSVPFEREQVFAGLEDRFDALTDRCEVWPAGGFVLGGGGFELATGVALVADHTQVAGSLATREQCQADVAFGSLRRGEQMTSLS